MTEDPARLLAQRDRLAQACRLLRDTTSTGSYVHNVVSEALAVTGIPDPDEIEDHP